MLFIFSFIYACSPVKYVEKEDYLLERVNVCMGEHPVNRAGLKRTIRQKPNMRILGISRFHLGLYNLSGRDESKKINQWLRRIGEAPVVYSPFLTGQSIERMESYLRNRGYYKANVTDSVWFKRRKAFVQYKVDMGPLTVMEDVVFRSRSLNVNSLSEKSGLLGAYYRDTVSTLLKTGDPLDMEVLDKERERITRMLREKGYFNFSKNFIQFFADSSSSQGKDIAQLFVRVIENAIDTNVYQRYFVQNIYIDFDYDPLLNVSGADTLVNRMDYNGYTILYRDKLKIKPKMITETIQISRMELYNAQQVLETYSRLQALNLFRFINVEFKEVEGGGEVRTLDCVIQLTPLKRQFYTVFVEGTHTSGNLGVGGNFTYNHRNLFKGGENLSIGFWGTLKKGQLDRRGNIFNTHEIGAEIKLVTPQFWLPFFQMQHFRRDYAPKTAVSISSRNENTPYYTRFVANASFGYLWRKSDKHWRYNLNIAEMNYVWMKRVDQEFMDSIKNDYIKSAYKTHMILSSVFSVVYTDQDIRRPENNSNYFRVNVESSGNLLWSIDRMSNRSREGESGGDRYYTCLGVRYAQFLKADAEYRFNWYINRANSLVWRFFIGCGYPYGNMRALPFEESYYSGGANDLRAWQVRMLGPGSFPQPLYSFPNSVGDFKLAANMEYRFKLVWLLEGALFVDTGNVWNINSIENRADAKLSPDFYKQLAVGTGAGVRVNANYFLLRFDWGFKMRDPMKLEGNRFVLFTKDGGLKNSVFNVAIGYPF